MTVQVETIPETRDEVKPGYYNLGSYGVVYVSGLSRREKDRISLTFTTLGGETLKRTWITGPYWPSTGCRFHRLRLP